MWFWNEKERMKGKSHGILTEEQKTDDTFSYSNPSELFMGVR